MSYPVIGANLSQMLFKQDEKLSAGGGQSVAYAFTNLSSLGAINSMPQELNDMQSQFPAYLSQSHLSTYYQDNPYPILTASNKFGVETMGGEIDAFQAPGYRPGNTFHNFVANRKHTRNSITPSVAQGSFWEPRPI